MELLHNLAVGFGVALTPANLTPEGVIKLSLGKKRHVLLRPA